MLQLSRNIAMLFIQSLPNLRRLHVQYYIIKSDVRKENKKKKYQFVLCRCLVAARIIKRKKKVIILNYLEPCAPYYCTWMLIKRSRKKKVKSFDNAGEYTQANNATMTTVREAFCEKRFRLHPTHFCNTITYVRWPIKGHLK